MSESSCYDPQAEAELLHSECIVLLNRIKRKRLNNKLLKASKHFLELTLNYKEKDSKP
jgi:hypothetical protein